MWPSKVWEKMFPAKSSYSRGSRPKSSKRLADFSNGLEFLLARVPLAWKCLRSPQISSPTPSRALAHIWDGKGKMIPSGDSKHQKNSTGAAASLHGDQGLELSHLLVPHTWTLCPAGSQTGRTETHSHTSSEERLLWKGPYEG